jgi:hypothetical protein
MKLSKFILSLALIFGVCGQCNHDILAKSGGGFSSGHSSSSGFSSHSSSSGFSSSKSSSSGFSSPKSSGSSSWGSSSKSSSPSSSGSSFWGGSSTWGSSSKSSSPSTSSNGFSSSKNSSSVDVNVYNAAKANGTAFTSKDVAIKDFQSKYSSKYTSKFSSEPESRPSYIPKNTVVGGNTYNVTYNRDYGGYGYMNSLGQWIMYDLMLDSIHRDSVMANHGYYYGPAPGHPIVWIIIIFIILIVFCLVLRALLKE